MYREVPHSKQRSRDGRHGRFQKSPNLMDQNWRREDNTAHNSATRKSDAGGGFIQPSTSENTELFLLLKRNAESWYPTNPISPKSLVNFYERFPNLRFFQEEQQDEEITPSCTTKQDEQQVHDTIAPEGFKNQQGLKTNAISPSGAGEPHVKQENQRSLVPVLPDSSLNDNQERLKSSFPVPVQLLRREKTVKQEKQEHQKSESRGALNVPQWRNTERRVVAQHQDGRYEKQRKLTVKLPKHNSPEDACIDPLGILSTTSNCQYVFDGKLFLVDGKKERDSASYEQREKASAHRGLSITAVQLKMGVELSRHTQGEEEDEDNDSEGEEEDLLLYTACESSKKDSGANAYNKRLIDKRMQKTTARIPNSTSNPWVVNSRTPGNNSQNNVHGSKVRAGVRTIRGPNLLSSSASQARVNSEKQDNCAAPPPATTRGITQTQSILAPRNGHTRNAFQLLSTGDDDMRGSLPAEISSQQFADALDGNVVVATPPPKLLENKISASESEGFVPALTRNKLQKQRKAEDKRRQLEAAELERKRKQEEEEERKRQQELARQRWEEEKRKKEKQKREDMKRSFEQRKQRARERVFCDFTGKQSSSSHPDVHDIKKDAQQSHDNISDGSSRDTTAKNVVPPLPVIDAAGSTYSVEYKPYVDKDIVDGHKSYEGKVSKKEQHSESPAGLAQQPQLPQQEKQHYSQPTLQASFQRDSTDPAALVKQLQGLGSGITPENVSTTTNANSAMANTTLIKGSVQEASSVYPNFNPKAPEFTPSSEVLHYQSFGHHEATGFESLPAAAVARVPTNTISNISEGSGFTPSSTSASNLGGHAIPVPGYGQTLPSVGPHIVGCTASVQDFIPPTTQTHELNSMLQNVPPFTQPHCIYPYAIQQVPMEFRHAIGPGQQQLQTGATDMQPGMSQFYIPFNYSQQTHQQPSVYHTSLSYGSSQALPGMYQQNFLHYQSHRQPLPQRSQQTRPAQGQQQPVAAMPISTPTMPGMLLATGGPAIRPTAPGVSVPIRNTAYNDISSPSLSNTQMRRPPRSTRMKSPSIHARPPNMLQQTQQYLPQ